jgi:hypothetical protein
MDFFKVRERETKGLPQAYPDWVVGQDVEDLMVRGGDFYAVWDEEKQLWSIREFDVQRLVDKVLYDYVDTEKAKGRHLVPMVTRNFETGSWEKFKKYVRSLPNDAHYHPLDTNITFADTEVMKKDYVSKRLPYSLREGPTDAWDELIGVLYSPEERDKIEWGIGSIVAGDSKWIQKFFVFYGPPASGKSTVISIIERLFEGYTSSFDAKTLTSSSHSFAMEAFATNPLVALQHDGDLSKIEDNTRLNSLVSHDMMTINVKYRSPFSMRPNAMVILGTNTPVKISNAKAGNTRRLIDIHPTGAKIEPARYHMLMEQVGFELGAIAWKCLHRYREMGKYYYEGYVPSKMMGLTDHFYNFVEAHFDIFKAQDAIQAKRIWEMYKEYCEESNIVKRLQYHELKDEASNYFEEFKERHWVGDKEYRSVYLGFKGLPNGSAQFVPDTSYTVDLQDADPEVGGSVLARLYPEAPAQGAKPEDGTPELPWFKVTSRLGDIDERTLHFVKVPESHIVIDFDLKDDSGEKSLARSIEEASKLPPTYTEVSQGGNGLHLHYIYEGDVTELGHLYKPGVEIKTLLGDASLRRRLTKCNTLAVTSLRGGLPKKEKKMLNTKQVKSEKGLRDLIERSLHKEFVAGTKPSVDFIHHVLEEAYETGLAYDVQDMRPRVLAFAAGSSNHARDCIRKVQTMRFVGKLEVEEVVPDGDKPLVFFDVEVYPNLFVVCWKVRGKPDVNKLINPSAEEVEGLFGQKLVGFNNRRYDNHILYARYLGHTNEELFRLSQKMIVDKDNKAGFREAYNLSYADIWDFLSTPKHGLKRFQIELGLHHHELEHPWDRPVPEGQWEKVVEYCANDVVTTEAVFEHRYQDFVARQILAELSGLPVNHTTQQHTARIIFGEDKNPQGKFEYTDLSKRFPGYVFDGKESWYCDETTGEGGYVYSEPGYYENVTVLDVVSMHPTSIVELNLFGPYTERFSDLLEARVAIKRKDYDKAAQMFDGKLYPFLTKPHEGYDIEAAEQLAYALKIVINIVYGLTSARFPNPFRDNRNVDNIVAKRGALFMIDLKNAVQEQGWTVVHIKTDSIKIPGADEEIIEFVKGFGKDYGYEFETEATYQKFCLVNDAVYIARSGSDWTAVGAQFQHPYVLKDLFTKEEITFDDLCELRSVQQGAMYLDRLGTGNIEDMQFVGRTGSFMPVKYEGGQLWRVKDDKKYHVTGTKDYLWVEREVAKYRQSIDDLHTDMDYFETLKGDALKAIEQYVPYEELVA